MGVLGEALKPAVEKCSPYTNAVDGDVVAKEVLDDDVVFVGIDLGIVDAVRDEQNDFAPPAIRVAVFEQLGRGIDSIIECLGGLALDVQSGLGNFRSVARSGVAVDGRSIVDRTGGSGGRLFIQAGTF